MKSFKVPSAHPPNSSKQLANRLQNQIKKSLIRGSRQNNNLYEPFNGKSCNIKTIDLELNKEYIPHRNDSKLKKSLNDQLRNAIRANMLDECNNVKNIVRNSVKNIIQILNNDNLNSLSFRNLDANKILQRPSTEITIKSFKTISNNGNSSNKGKKSRKINKEKKVVLFRNKKFYSLLLAVYKGWKTRMVIKDAMKKGLISDIIKLKKKLCKFKQSASKGVMLNASKFKKQQLIDMIEAKVNSSVFNTNITKSPQANIKQ